VTEKAHLLIIGCGDVAVRALPALTQDWSVTAVMRSAPSEALRQRFAAGAVQWLQADLDDPPSLQRALQGLPLQAEALLHSAPPPAAAALMHSQGSPTSEDSRTRHLLQVLTSAVNAVAKTGHNHSDKTAATLPRHLVYISTSGVYGDCAGALVDESHALQPTTARALRRVDAEQQLSAWAAQHGRALTVLRAPGIYAADRLPLERLRAGTPVLSEADDVYTNHIHAEDLAAMVVRALQLGRTAPQRVAGVFNASDDRAMHMGAWFDLVADRHGLPRPPRVPRSQAAACIPPMMLSFMNESRRLDNRRIKQAFDLQLRYPTVFEGVPQMQQALR
jgi:nucleoside-diphosphate-sugar epimerase